VSNNLVRAHNRQWLNREITLSSVGAALLWGGEYLVGENKGVCFYVSMCFLPKRRASTDHAPGPIMAAVPPRVASMIGIEGSPTQVKAIHSSTTATKVPTSGVHMPTRRSIPAHAPITRGIRFCGIIEVARGVPVSWTIPRRTSIVPARIRWSRRPKPGQPLAKVEKSRCNKPSDQSLRQLQRDRNRP